MPRSLSARRLLLAGSALLLISAAAEAELRYVSSNGSDAKTCKSPATACRSLQRGINVTPAGGEVRILDSGYYGRQAVIGKHLTISADGEVVMLDSPVTINGDVPVVTLRGLSLNGRYRTGSGVYVANAFAVHIDDCTIERFIGNGIESVSNTANLFVKDSVVRNNGQNGLYMAGTAARLSVENSGFEHNTFAGIRGDGVTGSVTRAVASENGGGIVWVGGSVSVLSSMAASNSGAGYEIHTGGGRMHLESSVAHSNGGFGLFVQAGATASISNFTATANQVGIHNAGTVLTRQNNTLSDNTTSIYGSQPTQLPPI